MQHSFPILLQTPLYMETKVFNKTLSTESYVLARLRRSRENSYSLAWAILLMNGVLHWCWKPTSQLLGKPRVKEQYMKHSKIHIRETKEKNESPSVKAVVT